MMYAIVKGGRVVDAPVSLRPRYQGVRAFHLLTDAERTKHGWYPCIPYGYNYDPDRQVQHGPYFEFTGEVVKMIFDNREMTPEESARRMAERKQEAVDRINKEYESEVDEYVSMYPETEKKTWDKQDQEARAYTNSSDAATPLLDSIAEGRGISKDELVAKVIAKADEWSIAVGNATGKRQRLESIINGAMTFDEIDSVEW